MPKTAPVTLLFCALVLAPAAFAEHRPLLPKPQRITYRDGQLPIAGLAVQVATDAAVEDRFAAQQLAARLSEVSGARVSVGDHASGRAIVLKRTGAVAALPAKDEKPGPGGRESYRLRITQGGVELTAPSSAGLFYGVQTIAQLVEGAGASAALPMAEAEDWPSLAYRGFMMDLSHGSILREDEIKRQIDFLARWKANQYYFYSEMAIEMKGYPLINRGARYSQDEVRRIVEYARERHVDVVPCVELFAHLHDAFRLERYSSLAAMPHGSDLNPRNPQAQEMLKDWIAQLAGLFPSPWFHIGLDEPFELEKEGVRAAGGIDAPKLYRDHLEFVSSAVRAHGKRVLFWADIEAGARIFTKYPELISQLPADVTPVPWYYSAKPDYTPWVEPFGKAGKPTVIAPGITCYNEIFPDYNTTFTNIDGFLAAGRKHGAVGIINTGWTDDAQTLYRLALPGMAYGAAASWQTAPAARDSFFSDYAAQMYKPEIAADIASAFTGLNSAQTTLAEALGDNTMWGMWDDALLPARIERSEARREQLREARLRAEDAMERIDRAFDQTGDQYTLPTLALAARMLDYLGMKHQYGAEIASFFRKIGPHPSSDDRWLYLNSETSYQDHSRSADLMDTITSLREAYRRAWDAEWTDYRRGTALGRWDAEYEYWRHFSSSLRAYLRSYKQTDTLAPLETFRPKDNRPE